MCDPVSVALSVASSLFQYSAQQDAYNAQVEATNEATARQYEMMLQQSKEQQQQINMDAQFDKSERIKQGLIERAQIATIAGESGALGFSADRLIGDSYMQQAVDIGSMETNRQNAIRQTEWEQKRAREGGMAARNEAASKPQPSLLATGLQIASDGYSVYKESKAKGKEKGTA